MAGGRRNRTRMAPQHKNPNECNTTNQHSATNNIQNGSSSISSVQSLPVCHPNIPNLNGFGSITFEVLFIIYLSFALFCQYIYLFKTTWWYPVEMPPSTTALNFHLIDQNLTFFIVLVLSRRLIWSFLWNVLRPRSDSSATLLAWLIGCLMVALIWITCLLGSLIYISFKSPPFSVLALCYPIIFWIPFTIFSSDSSVHLVLSWLYLGDWDNQGQSKHSENNNHQNSLKMPLARLLDKPESIGDLKTSYANLGNALDANQVRFEVKLLCRDFNSRVSEIVICSVICSYYVGLVPMFFMKGHQYFDESWCLQHAILVLLNSFLFTAMHLLHPKYLHVMHKCASLLGGYEKVPDPNLPTNDECLNELPISQTVTQKPVEVLIWTKMTVFPRGVYVHHKDQFYKSLNNHNTAEPDDSTHYRFYYMFNDPLRILNWILASLAILVFYQLRLILVSSKWDQLITLAVMQFFSYYLFCRALHDRIVLGKAYFVHRQLYANNTL